CAAGAICQAARVKMHRVRITARRRGLAEVRIYTVFNSLLVYASGLLPPSTSPWVVGAPSLMRRASRARSTICNNRRNRLAGDYTAERVAGGAGDGGRAGRVGAPQCVPCVGIRAGGIAPASAPARQAQRIGADCPRLGETPGAKGQNKPEQKPQML